MPMAKISVCMCSALPLAASSLPSLISFIPWSEGCILTHFYQTKYFQTFCYTQFSFSANRGSKSGTNSLSMLLFASWLWEQVWATLSTFFPLYRLQEREFRMRQGSCVCSPHTQNNSNALGFVIFPSWHTLFFMCHWTFVSAGRKHLFLSVYLRLDIGLSYSFTEVAL